MLILKRLKSLSCNILNTFSSFMHKVTELFWFTAHFSISHSYRLEDSALTPCQAQYEEFYNYQSSDGI